MLVRHVITPMMVPKIKTTFFQSQMRLSLVGLDNDIVLISESHRHVYKFLYSE